MATKKKAAEKPAAPKKPSAKKAVVTAKKSDGEAPPPSIPREPLVPYEERVPGDAKAFDVFDHLHDGWKVERTENGWNVTDPTGGHGFSAHSGGGSTFDVGEAIKNIGATVIPIDGRRVLHRVDGTTVELDPSLVPTVTE